MSIQRRRRTKPDRSLFAAEGADALFRLLLFGLVLATVAVLLASWLGGQSEADRCLDAGGCWVGSESRCELVDGEKCRAPAE